MSPYLRWRFPDQRQPLFDLDQPLGIEFQPVGVALQIPRQIGQLLQQSLPGRGCVRHVIVDAGQTFDSAGGFAEAVDDARHPAFAFVQQGCRSVCQLQEGLGIAQPFALHLQVLLFTGLQGRFGNLIYLKAEQVEALGDGAGIAAQALQLSARLLNLMRLARYLAAQGQQAAVPVEQVHVCAGTEQIQMLPLSVDVDEEGGHFTQELPRDGTPVDAAEISPAAAHFAAEDQCFRRVGIVQPFGLQQTADVVCRGRPIGGAVRAFGFTRRHPGIQLKDGFDLCAVCARAHHIRRCPVAQQQSDGVDNDRFAGAGFPGQDVQAGVETKLQPVDDREVADLKFGQRRGRFDLAAVCGQESWLHVPLFKRGVARWRSHGSEARPCRIKTELLWLSF